MSKLNTLYDGIKQYNTDLVDEQAILESNCESVKSLQNNLTLNEKKIHKQNNKINELNDELATNQVKFENICGVCYMKNESGPSQSDIPERSNSVRSQRIIDENSEYIEAKEEITEKKGCRHCATYKPEHIDLTRLDQTESALTEQKRVLHSLQSHNTVLCREMDEFNNQKRSITDVSYKRLESLRTYSKDTYSAVMWLRNNQNVQFQDEIIEPCYISLKIKNNKYIKEVEGTMSFNLSTTFIVKNRQDFVKFAKIMKDEQGWGINIIEHQSYDDYDNKFENNSVPDRRKIKDLGFDGYLIDFVEDRHEILEYLAHVGNFNSIPVYTNKDSSGGLFNSQNNKAMNLLRNPNSVMLENNIKRMIVNSNNVSLKKSIYNPYDSYIQEYPLRETGIYRGGSTMNWFIFKIRLTNIRN